MPFKVYLTFILIVLIFFSNPAFSSRSDNKEVLEMRELLSGAKKHTWTKPDSALAPYYIIIEKYKNADSEDEIKICLEALIESWRISFYKHYDFVESYRFLSKAKDYAESHDIEMPEIYHDLGIFYQTVSEILGDEVSSKKAFLNYRQAFWSGINEKNPDIDIYASNLFNYSFIIDSIPSIKKEYEAYKDYGYNNDSQLFHFVLSIYEGLESMKNKRYDKSLEIFDSMLDSWIADESEVRNNINVKLFKAHAYKEKGDVDKSILILNEIIEKAEENSAKDILVEAFGLLAQCHLTKGNQLEYLLFDNRRLALKDSLMGFRQLERLNAVQNEKEVSQLQESLLTVEHRNKNLSSILIMIIIFAIVLLFSMYLAFDRNKKLKLANEALFLKNLEQLRQIDYINKLKVAPIINREEQKPELPIENLTKNCAIENFSEDSGKYRNSLIDENTKNILMDKILSFMDNSKEFLNPEFSLEKLAGYVDSKYKTVSQVINEKYGGNFNTFVNKYRINEACRRIADREHYGNYTLDAISKSVGFRSRTTFLKAFKSFTGLSPSEFLRMASK